jgi:membrane fusion protein (multidrug efflux system)
MEDGKGFGSAGPSKIAIRLVHRPLLGFALLVTVAACGAPKQALPPAQAPEVSVVTVRPEPVAITVELPGRTAAYLVAQVRARVDGIVLRREFKEGADVKAGERLYKIDPAPYQAALDNAKATLAKAQANLASTTAQAERYKVLLAGNAVSHQDYDNAVAAQGQGAADVAAGNAAVETASINLGYTDVVSPISGRIGVSLVTQGAYVQASAATLLATVQQIDSIYVDVTQSSVEGLRLRQEVESGRLQLNGPNQPKVDLVLENGSRYPINGTLQFTDITVDQGTGSVTVRAIFPNPHRVLLPGMFVRARIEEGVNEHAILVPETGVTHDQKGQATALVVGPDDKVSLRALVAPRVIGGRWLVESGLEGGERVIVSGVQKVQPGGSVRPVEAQSGATLAGAGPGAPAASSSGQSPTVH